jgi:hypothetical protein
MGCASLPSFAGRELSANPAEQFIHESYVFNLAYEK